MAVDETIPTILVGPGPPNGKFGPPFIPQGPPPEGMVMGARGPFPADRSNLPYNGAMILGVTTFLTGLSMLVIALRLYVRHFMLKAFSWDDGIISWAALHSIGLFVCVIMQVQNGAGRHWYHIQVPEEWERYREWQYGHIAITILGVSVIKMSIGFSILRFVIGKKTRWATITLMGLVVAATIASFGPWFFECIPMSNGWSYRRDNSKCYPTAALRGLADTNATMNVVTDFLFVLLPIPTVWKLQVNMRTKLSLVFVLSIGALVGCTALGRMLGIKPGPLQMVNDDSTWNIPYFLWSCAELNGGIIAASLPPLRPLVAKFLGEMEERFRTGVSGSDKRYGLGSTSGGPNASRVNGNGWQRQYDDGDVPLDSSKNWKTSATITSSRVDRKDFDSGSEEMILGMGHKSGVMRQTEIRVQEDKI